MATTSYGSITIVDITDVGEFSVYPVGNMPLSVIYDPDQDSYTPTWGSPNLILTPVVYYAGNQLALSASGLTITWKRQEGTNGSTETLNTGETVSGGILTVSQNQFTPSSSMITYIVVATYVEPSSGQTLVAQGQMTFALMKQVSTVKYCKITGGNVFKYDTDGDLVGASSIALSATVAGSGVEISEWQYLNASGNYVQYPGSGTGDTLTVKAETTTVFVNDVCTIKLLTTDSSVYDIHTIAKLKDGAAGSGTVSAVLTNDDQMIPFTSGGIGDFSEAISQIIIYEGGVDVTSKWTIAQTASGVTATPSATTKTNDTTTVTAMSGSTGNVTFTCTRTGYNSITKTFSLVKVQSGADGKTPTIYSLSVSALAVNESGDETKVFTPSTVTFNAYSQTGNNAKAAYSGRFKIFVNGSSTASYTSSSNESSYTYTPTDGVSSIKCVLYAAGGTSTQLDSQTVVITKDGTDGKQGNVGPQGVGGFSVLLGNYFENIPCDANNKTLTAMPITIPFSGYKGIERVACTLTTTAANAKLWGITPTITQATTSADGSIVYTVPKGTTISSDSGSLSLTFSCEGNSVVHVFGWSRTTQAKNAVIMQMNAPQGDIFNNGSGDLPIEAILYEGSTKITSDITYQWSKFNVSNGTYDNISGATSSTTTISATTVAGYASYRCAATYDNTTYYGYISLRDKSDPLQVSVFSSLGSQIVNGNGYGALYVKVTRNGQEIDPLLTEVFSTSAPASPATGDYYYHITRSTSSTTGSIQLKQYSGSSWVNQSETFTATYTWTYRDGEGNIITPAGLATSGKIIYIDGDLIDGKIVADVQVTV